MYKRQRRSNVNVLIKKLHETIREIKPWVKFGVSPFGIYRNESSDPLGSKTKDVYKRQGMGRKGL